MAVVLTINHPRKVPPSSAWTFWGDDEDALQNCLASLDPYRTPLDHRFVNPEIAALVLRRDDRLKTILGAWTKDALPTLVSTLPDRFANLRTDLAEAFGVEFPMSE